ncbi:MAG TPA: NAD(P)-dependent oxidoreductase [Paracoccaceae bacterium]|nr:NAD(P)-dependent oxidoreductase [Paracoccaceae bacterium]HMO71036.1 NAD(P)-dependent oxidoreductase [Paracoccaceae bacterium]
MTEARVLITGAGGFVGNAIAAGLIRLGWQVCALDRVFDAPARARLAGAQLVSADLATAALSGLPRAEVVIHAAALTTGPGTLGITAAEHVRRNMAPLLAALDLATGMVPRAFVFLSSTGVFAPGDGDPDLTDASVPTATGPYSAAKRAGEVLVPSALPSDTAPHVVRLGHVCGLAETARPTRQRLSALAAMVAAARAGRPVPVPAPDPLRDWTVAEDLGPALARLVAGPAAGRVLHLGGPHRLTDGALAARIAARVPGVRIELQPPSADASAPKPPMRPSAIPALEGFAWTRPEDVIDALCAAEVAA